ncbi:ribonuclease H-like domain-containing protein [Tanacetum coccineum]
MPRGLDQLMERKEGGGIYLLWVPLIGDVRTLMMDEAHASRYLVHSGADKTYYDLRDMYGGHVWRRILLPMLPRLSSECDTNWVIVDRMTKCMCRSSPSWWKIYFEALVDIAEGIENTAKTCVRLIILKRIDKAEVGESGLIRPSWYKRQPTRVEVGDKVMLEVSSWKDVVHLEKKEMLALIYKYLADTNLHVHLEEIKVDKTFRFIEEPVRIIDGELSLEVLSKVGHIGLLTDFSAPLNVLSDSLLLTLMCCDDIHDVTPCVSALAGCDNAGNPLYFQPADHSNVPIFLMGLNDVYQPVRSNLLAREPLPEVKDAFAIVSREESHRRLSPGKLSVKNSPTTFVVRTNNNNNKSNRRVSSNINNNRGPNPNFVCKHYDLIGHTIDKCYEMNGYPVGFKRNPNLSKQSGSMKKFNGNVDVSQTTFTSSGSMPGIRPSFFNSNTYFNLHFEKFFCAKTNAYILKLTVGHPNGTMAKITTIGSLRLTDNVVLFDVLVVPKYNISMLSINKMIKDSKYFVGFDESKCYIQDLKLGKILGTGSESAGLYMFDCGDNGKSNVGMCHSRFVSHVSKDLWHCRLGHPADQVLSVIGDKIGFKTVDHSSACDIYHKANQTREPFSLSDHKSTGLGDLIHLDVWGPYRVVSRDGYKYFLISVDDYSRAVWVVRSDNGIGFVNSNMLNLFINSSIIHQTSCSYTPQQNGIAERKHRHLLNVARSLMFEGEILLSMWLECVLTATYLVNRLPSSVLSGASPFRLVYGKEPSLSHLRDFWCLCYSTVLNNSDKFGVSSSGVEPQRSSRNRTMHVKLNDFFVNSNVKFGLEKHVSYSKLSSVNYCFSTTLNKSVEPRSYADACKNENWINAMNQEMEALHRNNTWVLADLHVGRKAIRYKARLVAKGFSQRKGIDYEETFSLVVKMVTVICLIGLVVSNNWPLFQLDVNNVFYGDLHKEVYMYLPPGYYDNDETKVCRLINKKRLFIALLVYVDDIVITGNDLTEIEKFKQFLSSKFMIKDLGEYGLLACKSTTTPLQQNSVMCVKESEKDKYTTNMTDYQKLVENLIYLCVTRPDIAYVVHHLRQHMHAPLQSHYTTGLRVLRYLKQAPGTGIQFNKGNKFSLHAFSDANWAKCLNTRRSVSGLCEYLCKNFISWKSKKQQTISRSSTESEYRCLASTTCEIIWIGKILKDLDIEGLFHVNLYCDSSSAIQIHVNPVFHEKTKPFEIDLQLVKEKVSFGVIKTVMIGSAKNVADLFTNGLSISHHVEFCKKLGLMDMFKP